jgi:Zn-dependent peptidase ImmA (M78 family)
MKKPKPSIQRSTRGIKRRSRISPKLPRHVKVCGLVYWVTSSDVDDCSDLQEARGFTNLDTNRIVIRKNMPAHMQRETLVHELLHAIWYHSGVWKRIGLTDRKEEDMISTITPHLVAALVDIGIVK